MKIVGLDLSLTSTGVALPDGHTVTLHPKQYAVTGRRLNELWGLLYPLLDRHRPDVAVVEGYAYGANMPGSERRAEWVGCARLALERFRIPHIDVPPKKLKKWATGNGNADKAAMVQAALAAGGDPANDDEADAYLLRAIGVLQLDGTDLFHDPEALPSRQLLADDLDWSDLLEATHAYR